MALGPIIIVLILAALYGLRHRSWKKLFLGLGAGLATGVVVNAILLATSST